MEDIHLEKVDPEKNCFRFYAIAVEGNLFGDNSLVVRWGRIGRMGNLRIDASGSDALMTARALALSLRKQREGYRRS